MSAISRIGQFGTYWGNTFDTSITLTQSQMETNALYIYRYLSSKGWTKNAIAGMLGNMQAESSINPGRWQSDRVGGDATGHGYGLVQWTPYTKYTEWCNQHLMNDPSTMDANLSRIVYEVTNSIQWIGVGAFSDMSFEDFSKSTLSPSELGKAFVLCYERPADQSESVQAFRGGLAQNWYEFLGGVTPINPSKKKRKKYNFILFNRRRRMFNG